MTYVKVASKLDIPIGKMKKITLESKEILIANVKGTYYAIGNTCPHKGGDLSKGTMEENTVTCPNHQAKFDLATGKVISPPKVGLFHPKIQDEPSYSLKVENDDILIRL